MQWLTKRPWRRSRFGSEGAALGPRKAMLFGACLLWSCFAGCAFHGMEVVERGMSVDLAENEGILILHVDTDVELKRLSLRSGQIAEDLPKGEHVWIVRARSGEHAWNRVDFGKEFGRRAHVYVEQFDGLSDEEFIFEIKAGSINYPGALIVRSETTPQPSVWIRNRNHSAMAVRALLTQHPELLQSLPLRYAGSSGDEFLEFYTKERNPEHSDLEAESR